MVKMIMGPTSSRFGPFNYPGRETLNRKKQGEEH
jgi:hypothetical protein